MSTRRIPKFRVYTNINRVVSKNWLGRGKDTTYKKKANIFNDYDFPLRRCQVVSFEFGRLYATIKGKNTLFLSFSILFFFFITCNFGLPSSSPRPTPYLQALTPSKCTFYITRPSLVFRAGEKLACEIIIRTPYTHYRNIIRALLVYPTSNGIN